MNLKEIGSQIKAQRDGKGEKQDPFLKNLNAELKKKYPERKEVDASVFSRIENGIHTDKALYERICTVLSIKYLDDRLRIAFSQGFWAAPIVAVNAGAHVSFFEHVALSSYTEKATNKVIFSDKNERLPPFNKEKHAFYSSGEIVNMLRNDKVDVGFLGSPVVEDEKDLVRIARLNNADSMRHAMVTIAPKGEFKNTKEVITHLLTKKKATAKAHIYYHQKSTAEIEFRTLLQHAEHYHNTLDVLDAAEFKQRFTEKLIEHKGKVIAHLGLMLSIEWAREAAQELDAKNRDYDIFTFRTSEIVSIAQKLNIKDLKVTPFFYEMVVRRSKEKIQRLAKDNKGFQDLLMYLPSSVKKLSDIKTDRGIPLEHNQVAHFFGFDAQEMSAILKKLEFELVYYPEWVNKVLGIV